jgi:hypothetical protein
VPVSGARLSHPEESADQKGGHFAREASGHTSDRYIWRYVKPSQQTLEEAVDALD